MKLLEENIGEKLLEVDLSNDLKKKKKKKPLLKHKQQNQK